MGIRKRALSLFVTFAMCFSILPSSVWAVEANRPEESVPVSADVVEALPLTAEEVTSAEAALEDAPALPEDDAPVEAADVPMEEGEEVFPDDAITPEDGQDAGVLPQEDAAVDEPSPQDAGALPEEVAAIEEPSPQIASPREETFLVDEITPEDEPSQQAAGAVDEDGDEALPEKGEPEEVEEPAAEKSVGAEAADSYAPGDEEKATDTELLSENEREERLEAAGSDQVLWSDITYLDPGWSVAYSYTPAVSATYTFESTNASGDVYGWLTPGDSDTVLISNDDGGRANGNYRNFSFSYNLTAGTTYRLHARWYSSSESGTIVCQLSRSASIEAITADGVTRTATITAAGQYAYFSFVPSGSGTYVFESTNTSGDPYGYLYDSSWNVLASNDDGAGNSNFRISYVLTAGTTYYFGVRFWSSSATGDITVRLTGENPARTLTPPTSSNPVTEDYEEITTLGERKYFKFIPQVTGRYIFESTNTSNDPVGELYEADKTTQMASNDDGAGNRNFRLVYDRDLVAGTTYYYAVRFFGSSTLGRIDVRLTLSNGDVVPNILNAAEVTLKGYTTASVDPDNTSNSSVSDGRGYFSFTPPVSGTYLFESTNSSGDAYGYLYDRVGGTELSSNDDGGNANGNTHNFRVSYSLSAGTTYIYAARWYSSSSSGTIEVRVRRALSELATTMQPGYNGTATISALGQVVYFGFTPPATQDYSFESSNNVASDSSIFDPYVTLYDADFNSLGSNDDGGEGRNFYITSNLTQGTTYYYGVSRLNDFSTGSASVRLSGGIPDATIINAAAVERDGLWSGSANISTAGEYAYFLFTPQSSGAYIFESTNSTGDTHGHFYENGLGTTSTADNDDGGDGLNFRLAQNLEAGRTYAFAARWHWSGDTGTIDVRMVKDTVPVVPLDAAAVEQNNIITSTANIATSGRRVYFSFRPQSSGSYIFESTNTSGDTYGYLYDSSWRTLTASSSCRRTGW